MQDQHSDGHTTADPVSEETEVGAPRRHRRRRRTDWRLGGTAVRPWNGGLLAVALFSLGAAIVAGSLVTLLWRSPWAPLASTVVLWIGMLIPVIVAFRRGRPAGLLRFRPADLVYALALGLALRVADGWISDAASRPFPSASVTPSWLLMDALPAGLIAPVIEEFFFRTVILIAVYSALRRPAGRAAAALAAVLVSTSTFILIHVVDGSLPLAESLSVGIVGIVCATLVVLTGRIWGAVLVHIVYNATLLLLMAAGGAISGGQ